MCADSKKIQFRRTSGTQGRKRGRKREKEGKRGGNHVGRRKKSAQAWGGDGLQLGRKSLPSFVDLLASPSRYLSLGRRKWATALYFLLFVAPYPHILFSQSPVLSPPSVRKAVAVTARTSVKLISDDLHTSRRPLHRYDNNTFDVHDSLS